MYSSYYNPTLNKLVDLVSPLSTHKNHSATLARHAHYLSGAWRSLCIQYRRSLCPIKHARCTLRLLGTIYNAYIYLTP